MKFWIRINGLQEGPMEIDQMRDYNVTPTTYVWCAGMKDWAYARDVEDLKDVIVWDNPSNEVPATSAVPEQAGESAPAEEIVEPSPELVQDDEPQPETETEVEAETETEPTTATVVEENEAVANELENTTDNVQQAEKKEDEQRPCPPNNLVWAILSTIFCCQITGIIAIVFAAQVNSKYEESGYEAAKKYSNWAAWWCIAGVILVILGYSILLPFLIFAPMLSMAPFPLFF